MQSFRASPWVSYEPSLRTQQDLDQPISGSEMEEDIDMEAPHISTLKDEESPPPKTAAVNSKKRHRLSGSSAIAARESDEVDEEEDQLIDELFEYDGNGNATKASPSSRSTDAAQKRKTSAKRKPRKVEKKPGETDKRTKDKAAPTSGLVIAPTISIFNANPADAHEDMDMNISTTPMAQVADSSSENCKKTASPQKLLNVSRAKGKVAMSVISSD